MDQVVTANDAGSQMCGWLQRRSKRSWKRLWFVLKEQVLYVYKASEDVVALETIPVLGYRVEPMKQKINEQYLKTNDEALSVMPSSVEGVNSKTGWIKKTEIHFQLYEGIDAKLVFQLAHPNQQPLVFSADSENLVNRWIAELQKATVLK
ncbi:FYVE, RhoGEF and PH domain-containing protein 6 [Gryllus bimaculatus]|nr:FYVE, RhoGEF and PH domain-containing protein 6 [Gryllus bimaculatus]